MQTFWQNLRFSLRGLRRNPAFTIAAVLSLALGLGAVTTAFSLVDGLFLRPLPYADGDRLALISQLDPDRSPIPVSWPDFKAFRDQATAFTAMAAYDARDSNLTGAYLPERVHTVRASANLLPLLGVQPVAGRSFRPEEEVFGRHLVALVSHAFWQRRFGGDPGAVGRTITLDGQNLVVVGVLPPAFAFPSAQVEVLTPFSVPPGDPGFHRGDHNLDVVARVKDGASLGAAQAELQAVQARLSREFPDDTGIGAKLTPLREHLVGHARGGLVLLSAAVVFILLICCANVANLLLARAAARQREMSVRAALGAGRAQIVRQLLTESLVLTATGAALGLLLAVALLDLFTTVGPDVLRRAGGVALDLRPVLFAGVLVLPTALLFGLAPTLHAVRSNTSEVLRAAGRDAEFRGRRFRAGLVSVEVALATVLLVGAGLLVRQVVNLLRADLGIDPDAVLTVNLSLPEVKPDTSDPRRTYQSFDRENGRNAEFLSRVMEALAALPGVEAVGASTNVPLEPSHYGKYVSIEGQPAPATLGQVRSANYHLVVGNYFQALGIELQRGRLFEGRDRRTTPRVAILNETAARTFFPGADPIGRQLWMGPPEALLPPPVLEMFPDGKIPRATIVGIVKDVRSSGPAQPVEPEVYALQSQNFDPVSSFVLLLRAPGNPPALANSVREAVARVNPAQPVSDILTMDQRLGEILAQQRFQMATLLVFAGIAFLMALVGVYGVTLYQVAQRRREFGVRVALGATSAHLSRLVVGQGMILVGVGVALGGLTALGLSRVLSSLVEGVESVNPTVYALAVLLMLAAGLAATLRPARRAATVDPIESFRDD